jgi:hypothetical protein
MRNKILSLLHHDKKVNVLWFVLPLIATLIQTCYDGGINNYLIYKNVYYNTLKGQDLFACYPDLYIDKNHYGILYSLLIAPFTYLPDRMAIILYQFAQLYCLHFVIRKLPIGNIKQNYLLVFLIFEAIANCQNVQTNTFIGFIFVGTYVSIINRHEWKAALLILLGFLVKIYGIIGLGLFFFIKNKKRFIAWFIVFGICLYFLPLLITNASFIKESYISWFVELGDKNGTNIALDNPHQNMSAIGIVMKVLQNNHFSILYIVLPAFLLQVLPLIRYQLLQQPVFQMKYLASLMLFAILYSSSTETSTHIIGAIGMGIWWLTSEDYKSKRMLYFMAFCFIIGTLSTTDLVPEFFNRNIIRKYSLKALPYWIVWMICIYQLLFCINKQSINHE